MELSAGQTDHFCAAQPAAKKYSAFAAFEFVFQLKEQNQCDVVCCIL